MTKKLGISILLIALGGVFLSPVLWGADDAPDPMVLDQERRLKEDTERQAQAICDFILGKGQSNILVTVELGLESTKKGGGALNRKSDGKSPLANNDNFILPWVPAPKSVTKEEAPKDASVQTQAAQQQTVDVKTVVKRFDITVVHDKDVPEARIAQVKETLQSTFERFKNILKIYFRATSFAKEVFNSKETVKKNFLDTFNLKTLLLFFMLMLALPLLKFFFGPLASFMKDYIEGMKELSKSRVEMENVSKSENETDENSEGEDTLGDQALTPEEQALLEAEEEAMKKLEPFSYVNDTNIKQLAYMLHHEEPWIVALVISYLSPAHAFKVMEALPSDLQAKVALETAMYRQTSEEQVIAINEDIKQKIDFVVGGLDKLVGILESSDRFAQDNILEYLKNEKPAIYERVREQILLFDDIIGFPKMAMQAIVRELKTDELARALRGASPEMQQKFFDAMSQGAVALLKEEMEYGRPVTDEQIQEERKKIVDFIKKFEADGKISFRQRGKMGALSGDEMGSSSAGANQVLGAPSDAVVQEAEAARAAGAEAEQAGNLEEAIRHYESSVGLNPGAGPAWQSLAGAYYAAGRYPEALSAYDQALQLEPNPELQDWVNEFRASLPTAA